MRQPDSLGARIPGFASDITGGGGNSSGSNTNSQNCIPSVFNPSCKAPTCPAVYVDAILKNLGADGFLHATVATQLEPAAKAAAEAAVTARIVNRGLVVPLRSSVVRNYLLAGEVAGDVLLAAPVYKAEVVGFADAYKAARAGTCTTIWSK